MCSEVMNILAQNLKNATNKHVKKPVTAHSAVILLEIKKRFGQSVMHL